MCRILTLLCIYQTAIDVVAILKKKNHIVQFNTIYRTEFFHIAFNTSYNLTPLEIHQCVIVKQLLYLNAETLGTGVNVDVNLKCPLKRGGGGTALNSRAGGQHIAAQVRGQRQQGQTLSTGYNDTHDSGNIVIHSTVTLFLPFFLTFLPLPHLPLVHPLTVPLAEPVYTPADVLQPGSFR